MKPPTSLAAVSLVGQAPGPVDIAVSDAVPKLEPHLAKPASAQCNRMPLWRVYRKLAE
jgi:hypothetical protein